MTNIVSTRQRYTEITDSDSAELEFKKMVLTNETHQKLFFQ